MIENISPIIYPTRETSEYMNLYFKGKNFKVLEQRILIEKFGIIKMNTYYNSFSIEKWNYYTKLKNLFLKINCKGCFVLRIFQIKNYFDKVVRENLLQEKYLLNDFKEIKINLTDFLNNEGIIYYEIEAIEKTYLKEGGYFTTDIEKKVKIGIVFCTYKREKYIDRIIQDVQRYRSYKDINIFIVDNGKTLENIHNENIKIIQNENYGGAGGFARGMLELNNYNEKNKNNKIDYMIFMDDDIYIDFNVLDKLIGFLSLIKEEYCNYFFAGTMCSLDEKNIQYERYASWRGNHFIQMSPNFDLSKEICLLKNELIENIRYASAGWWFSCFNTNIIGKNNFPFPCFFRGDDMEYTIRNGSNIITLNGINVWHEPFYKKYSILAEDYYLLRNTLVINTLYYDWIKAKDNIKYLFKRFSKSIIKYDYKSAELIIRALDDYSKGVNFFINTDPELLNKELMKYNHNLLTLKDLLGENGEYIYDDLINKTQNEHDKNIIYKFYRLLTFNGNLLPDCLCKNIGVSLIGYASRAINFYKQAEVLNFDPFSRKGYYTKRNKKLAVKYTIKFIRKSFKYYREFKNIKKDYQSNFYKLQTETFWKKYLKI